jgi:hypothetical protein
MSSVGGRRMKESYLLIRKGEKIKNSCIHQPRMNKDIILI